MIAVVLNLNPDDPEECERALRNLGFTPQTVWVQHVSDVNAPHCEDALQRLGVGRFMVGSTWGRGPG